MAKEPKQTVYTPDPDGEVGSGKFQQQEAQDNSAIRRNRSRERLTATKLESESKRLDNELKKQERKAKQEALKVGSQSAAALAKECQRLDGALSRQERKSKQLASDLRSAKTTADKALSNTLIAARKTEVSSLRNTDNTQQYDIDCFCQAMSGNMELRQLTPNSIDADTLNAAAAGTHKELVKVALVARMGTNAVPTFPVHPFPHFAPVIGTFAEVATTGAIGAPTLEKYVDVPTSLAATVTWDTTTTVLFDSTAEISVGDCIQLDSDGQLFKIASIVTDTSATIENPHSLTIPSGATGSSRCEDFVKFASGVATFYLVPDTDAGATKTYQAGDTLTCVVEADNAEVKLPIDMQYVSDLTVTLTVV